MGEDADTLQDGMKAFLGGRVSDVRENAGKIGARLADGLRNARYCKDYCQHFVDALEGGVNEAVDDNHEIPGAMFCDYGETGELMGLCDEALVLADEIRQSADDVDKTLGRLEIVAFDVSPYTSAVRRECDRIDRLGMHKRNLENYAGFAEKTDAALARELGAVFKAFTNPNPAKRSRPGYGGLDRMIREVRGQEKTLAGAEAQIDLLLEIMDKPVESLTEEDRKAVDGILLMLVECGETDEIKKVIDHMGNGIDGVWTAGDIYAVARILDYSEITCNTDLSCEIYNKMIKMNVNTIKSKESAHTDVIKITYEYEMVFDSGVVAKVLEELDPGINGLAYYSLQRRCKYSKSGEKIVYDILPEKVEFDISFKVIDGKLVSIFDIDDKKIEIASVDMNKVVGKEEIERMLAMGYTHEAIALGLTSSEIELLERRGVHLTQEDIQNIGNTMYSENVKLSSDHKAVIYHGNMYYIDVPRDEVSIEPIWEEDGIKEYSKIKFDIVSGFFGCELEEVPKKTVIEEKKGIHIMWERDVSPNDKNVKGAAALSMLTGLTSFLDNSLSRADVEMAFESYGDYRRVRILVGDSKTRKNMQNINFNIPRNIYAINYDNVLVKNDISCATKSLYRELTGEEVPNPNGNYTVVASLNVERENMIYSGYLSYSEEGNLLYTPYIFPDEEAHISECTFMYGFEKEKIYDCTELLKQTTKVSSDVKELMEEAWENWSDE